MPILTYACEVKHFSCSEMHECHVAINDAIRRIFSFNRWESIRHLRESFGYRDLYTIFSHRKRSFLHRFRLIENPILHSLLNIWFLPSCSWFCCCVDCHILTNKRSIIKERIYEVAFLAFCFINLRTIQDNWKLKILAYTIDYYRFDHLFNFKLSL